jgi:putative glutamine amidotransferase
MRLEIETGRFYLGRDYCEALEQAGALPLHIPLIPDPDYIKGVVEGLDGVLLPGSDTDVDPEYYDEHPHPRLGRVVPEKDLTDRLVLEEAERLNIPVFAICYGAQALNVYRGGSLVQDIEAQVDNCSQHRQGKPVARNSHRITIETEGHLSSIASRVESETLKVNSDHHQAIREIGKDLVVSARANDGVIECVEDLREDRFVVGVQWHPELNWETDVLSKGLFERFVAECSSRSAAATPQP